MKINEYFYHLTGKDLFVTKRHFHNEIEIIEVVNGDGIVISGGNSYKLQSRHLYFIDARKPHIVNPVDVDGYIRNKIVIDADSFFEFVKSIGLGDFAEKVFTLPPISTADRPQIDRLFEMTVALCKKGKEGKGFAHALILELLHFADNVPSETNYSSSDIIQKILVVINSKNGLVSLGQLADELNYSKYYICHIFRNKTGVSLSHYIDSKRNELCIRELIKTKHPISVIADNCGFANTSSFTRFFKAQNGITPLKFRNSEQ